MSAVIFTLLARPPRRGSIVVARVNSAPRRYLPPIYSEALATAAGEARAHLKPGTRLEAAARALADQVRR
jgi:hypothetical protein